MLSTPVPWRKLTIFRCKKHRTLKHTIIRNEFIVICYKIIHILSVPFNHNSVIQAIYSTHSFKTTLLLLLQTCLVCLHYRNITFVFSKVTHSLAFSFLTGTPCSQILHFAEGTMLLLQGTSLTASCYWQGKNTKPSLLQKLWDQSPASS